MSVRWGTSLCVTNGVKQGGITSRMLFKFYIDTLSLLLCGIVWYCVVLCGIVWYYVVLCGVCVCGIVWYCVVLCGIVWYCVVLCGIVWYCVVLCGIVWHCVVLCGIGGYIGTSFVNNFCYANDLCLISLSSRGMQHSLNICKEYAFTHKLLYNGSKSFALCFKKNTLKVSSPSFYLDQMNIPTAEQCRQGRQTGGGGGLGGSQPP